jgi:putative pyruvate formate lyase activating enzyme
MSDLAKLTIWNDPAIRGALSWYLEVAENHCPAKFRIAATVATQLEPERSSEEELWTELDRLTPIFHACWDAVRAGAPLPPAAEGASLLELCRELAYRMLAHCNFCPWDCRVDRVLGAKFGACKLASGSRVSSHFHHTGEELFYRGTQGSGTIFFTCDAPSARTAISAPIRTMVRRWIPAHWLPWRGRCAAKVAIT